MISFFIEMKRVFQGLERVLFEGMDFQTLWVNYLLEKLMAALQLGLLPV